MRAYAYSCTVWLPLCSTVAPLARGVGGDIPGNGLGQGFTSSSGCTHLLGASGAPIGLPSGAADGCQLDPWNVPCTASVTVAMPIHVGRTQWMPVSAPVTQRRHTAHQCGTGSVPPPANTCFQPYVSLARATRQPAAVHYGGAVKIHAFLCLRPPRVNEAHTRALAVSDLFIRL